MYSIAKAIITLTAIAALFIVKTESKCCDIAYVTHHVCLALPTEEDLRIHLIWDFPIDKKQEYWMRNEADVTRPKCVSYFCEDGLPTTYHSTKYSCGVGKCNMFGCNCEGGCRQGDGRSYQEMGKDWREKHGLLEKARHKLKGKLQ